MEMNPNWLGVASLVLAMVAFFVAHRFASRIAQRSRRVLLAVAGVLLAVPGASFAVHYLHVLPEPAWYFQFRSLPGTELLMIPVGIAGGFVAALLPPLLRMLPLVGVAGLGAAPVLKPFIGPLPASSFSEEWSDGVCLQSTASTCGPASMATILRHFGESITEAQVAAAAHSYQGGTEAWYLARVARVRGCAVSFKFTTDLLPAGGYPAVVGVRMGAMGHFIAILAREGGRFRGGRSTVRPRAHVTGGVDEKICVHRIPDVREPVRGAPGPAARFDTSPDHGAGFQPLESMKACDIGRVTGGHGEHTRPRV